MRKANYIIFDGEYGPTPFIFPLWISHSSVFKSLGGELLSAGGVQFYGNQRGEAHCNVSTLSKALTGMEIESRPQDAKIIEDTLACGELRG